MDIVQRIDSATDRFVLRYASFLASLVGMINMVIAGPEPTSESNRVRYRNRAIEIGYELAQVERVNLLQATSEIIDLVVQQDADQYHVLRSLALDDATDVADTLRAQIERDGRSGAHFLRSFAFEVEAIMAGTNHGFRSAVVAARVKRGQPAFVYQDKIGRSHTSTNYVRLLVRSHLLTTYNEAVLFVSSAHGITEFEAKYEDPNHRNNGMRFVYGRSDASLPQYVDVKAKLFHPNSFAVVNPVV